MMIMTIWLLVDLVNVFSIATSILPRKYSVLIPLKVLQTINRVFFTQINSHGNQKSIESYEMHSKVDCSLNGIVTVKNHPNTSKNMYHQWQLHWNKQHRFLYLLFLLSLHWPLYRFLPNATFFRSENNIPHHKNGLCWNHFSMVNDIILKIKQIER